MSVIDYVGFQQTGNTEQVTWKIPIQRKANPFPFQLFFSLLLTVKSNVSETLFLFILLFLPLLPIVVTGTTPWKTNLKVFVPHIEYSIYWKSPPLIVPHPGVFQGGSWNDPYKKGKNNIRLQQKRILKDIAKGTADPRVEFWLAKKQVVNESWSNFIFIISTKHQTSKLDQTWLRNLDQE